MKSKKMVLKILYNFLNIQEKDDFKNSPKVYSVSSFEHDKLVEDDPEDRPRIFTEAKQTGIPDVKERITSIAELYRFDLFKQLVD